MTPNLGWRLKRNACRIKGNSEKWKQGVDGALGWVKTKKVWQKRGTPNIVEARRVFSLGGFFFNIAQKKDKKNGGKIPNSSKLASHIAEVSICQSLVF